MKDESRESFEALMKRKGQDISRCTFNSKFYHSIQTQLYYEHWLVCKAWIARHENLKLPVSLEVVARAIALSEIHNIAPGDEEVWLNRVWEQKISSAKAALTAANVKWRE